MATVRVGVSGWSFDEWKDTFYAGVRRADWLGHYAATFPTVEVNYTFRRTMSATTAETWAKTVPDDFRFAVKAHQRITHTDRLRHPDETLPHFLGSLGPLRSRLGPLLFQLPPHLRRDDERLGRFLAALPDDVVAVFEFRHDSWLTDEVYRALAAAGAGLVLSETDDEAVPDVVTAPVVYLRLRKSNYPDVELAAWADRIRAFEADEVWAFLKHEERSPDFALALIGHLG
ncbi:MAG: DUF72 domain-containing protein [Acidimicrobiia bacterium]